MTGGDGSVHRHDTRTRTPGVCASDWGGCHAAACAISVPACAITWAASLLLRSSHPCPEHFGICAPDAGSKLCTATCTHDTLEYPWPVPLVDRRWVRAFPSHRDRAPGAEYRPLWRQIPKTSACLQRFLNYSVIEFRRLRRACNVSDYSVIHPKTSACLQGFLNYSVINSEDFGVLPKTSACLQGFLNYSVINSIIYPVCSLSKI